MTRRGNGAWQKAAGLSWRCGKRYKRVTARAVRQVSRALERAAGSGGRRWR